MISPLSSLPFPNTTFSLSPHHSYPTYELTQPGNSSLILKINFYQQYPVSQMGSSHLPHRPDPDGTSPNKSLSPRELILSLASKISSQPLINPDPNVWGVLTCISNNARKRQQGINMLLTEDEHSIGKLVDDFCFQIESTTSGWSLMTYLQRVYFLPLKLGLDHLGN